MRLVKLLWAAPMSLQRLDLVSKDQVGRLAGNYLYVVFSCLSIPLNNFEEILFPLAVSQCKVAYIRLCRAYSPDQSSAIGRSLYAMSKDNAYEVNGRSHLSLWQSNPLPST